MQRPNAATSLHQAHVRGWSGTILLVKHSVLAAHPCCALAARPPLLSMAEEEACCCRRPLVSRCERECGMRLRVVPQAGVRRVV